MSETVDAQDVISQSKREGFLAKQLYVIFTTPPNGIKPVMDNIKEHLAFQVELEKDGIMFAAGPNWTDDEKSWEGDGMVVVRAKSLAEAKEIAARDLSTIAPRGSPATGQAFTLDITRRRGPRRSLIGCRPIRGGSEKSR